MVSVWVGALQVGKFLQALVRDPACERLDALDGAMGTQNLRSALDGAVWTLLV